MTFVWLTYPPNLGTIKHEGEHFSELLHHLLFSHWKKEREREREWEWKNSVRMRTKGKERERWIERGGEREKVCKLKKTMCAWVCVWVCVSVCVCVWERERKGERATVDNQISVSLPPFKTCKEKFEDIADIFKQCLFLKLNNYWIKTYFDLKHSWTTTFGISQKLFTSNNWDLVVTSNENHWIKPI